MSFTELFKEVREVCDAGTWSQAVGLTRSAKFIDEGGQEERVVKILTPGERLGVKVSFWPEDIAWSSDCSCDQDPCLHIAAAAIAIKNGVGLVQPGSGGKDSGSKDFATLRYAFFRKGEELHFERYLCVDSDERPFRDSLLNVVGGTSSGRIEGPQVSASREDFAVEGALGRRTFGRLDSECIAALFRALSNMAQLTLDGVAVSVSADPTPLAAEVVEEGEGFRIRLLESCSDGKRDVEGEEFSNGVVLLNGVLHPVAGNRLSAQDASLLSGGGTYYAAGDMAELMTAVLPKLKAKLNVEIRSDRLPTVVREKPRVFLQIHEVEEDLLVEPRLVYGDPPIADVRNGQLEPSDPKQVPLRNLAEEHRLTLQLRQDLSLHPGQSVRLKGREAVSFLNRSSAWETEGSGKKQFSVVGELSPQLSLDGDSFELKFEVDGVGRTEASEVFSAWKKGEQLVALQGGGWAKLPESWLGEYGSRVQQILQARDSNGAISAPMKLLAADLFEELDAVVPLELKELRSRLLSAAEKITKKLPEDLTANLRKYQSQGVHWLQLLTTGGFGALLADDMGLGKTLQALSVIEGRTLVIAPTSVLYSWREELKKFRPNLSFCFYYGPKRKLDENSEVTLTSYGTLRMDAEALAAENWQMVILDEAQTIKNPSSQTARAVFELKAAAKIALSGTPVENRFDDLWSQFRFLNPGLLGSQAEFASRYVRPIEQGDEHSAERLRRIIKPFLLRRTKDEVLEELPPKTEVEIYCELEEDERATYQAVYASTKKEVLQKLDEGGTIVSLLEALLRLRQAACHSALIPSIERSSSSKVQLLLDMLQKSFLQGHRALVFSQWTSFLDLIEPHLQEAGIEFFRLDGSTKNRGELVSAFQQDDGPPLMLISLRAGGLGLTLTAADHIYLMDPWWNPAVESQAADRAHRIGQENPVFIHRLIAKDTIEEQIRELQQKKLQLASSLVEGSGESAISRDDIVALFEGL